MRVSRFNMTNLRWSLFASLAVAFVITTAVLVLDPR
jgi:hypothetical protein